MASLDFPAGLGANPETLRLDAGSQTGRLPEPVSQICEYLYRF